jgi:pilus assembly protein CpaB
MAKVSKKGLLGIAVLLSLVTSMLLYNFLKNATKSSVVRAEATVVVAGKNIAARTKITPDMVKEVKMPKEYIQPGAVTSVKTAVGIIARENITNGEQLLDRMLSLPGKATNFSDLIPPDKRALTVAVSEVTGVAGFIKPGDYVDVIVTFDSNTAGDNVSDMILQNVLVLAVNHDTQSNITGKVSAKETIKNAVKAMTVTLAVSPDEASKVTLAEEKGRIRLALRPYMPQEAFVITRAVTPKDLVGNLGKPVNDNNQAVTAPPAPAAAPAPKPAATAVSERSAVPEGKTIQVIRGTKVDNVPVN